VSERNTLRSGDVHRSRQLDLVFSGRVRVTTRENGRDVDREYSAGEAAQRGLNPCLPLFC
jgi:hypothetical protein